MLVVEVEMDLVEQVKTHLGDAASHFDAWDVVLDEPNATSGFVVGSTESRVEAGPRPSTLRAARDHYVFRVDADADPVVSEPTAEEAMRAINRLGWMTRFEQVVPMGTP